MSCDCGLRVGRSHSKVQPFGPVKSLELCDNARARRGAGYTPLQPPEIALGKSARPSPWSDPKDTGEANDQAYVYPDTQWGGR